MGFRQGAYANVWAVENKGKYSTARLSISRRNQNTGGYDTEFQDGYVRLVGQAHEKFNGRTVPEKGEFIRINSCDVQNCYTKPDGSVSYVPHYTIFEFDFYSEISNNGGNSNAKQAKGNTAKKKDEIPVDSNGFMNIPDAVDDEELPFN